jgi:hypothetical protein
MPVLTETLRDKRQTGRAMYRLAGRFASDLDAVKVRRGSRLVPLSAFSLAGIFDFVRTLPYKRDVKPVEVVARPRTLLLGSNGGLDCKKKAVILGAYCHRNRLPYRFMAVSTRKNRSIHHVFPQVKIDGNWLNLDATYSHYKPFSPKLVTAAEVLPR